jgi:hypothetical protein
MPYYYSEAATADGKVRKRILKAFDEKDADRQLRKLGLRPILIESTTTIKKQKQEKALHTRHIVRNTALTVAAISVVVGVAGYLVLLDLRSDQPEIPSGFLAYASDINYGDTPDQREYAKYINDTLNKNFPGQFRTVSIRRKTLMLLYENEERPKLDDTVKESILSMITRGFQRQYNTKRCEVHIVRDEKPVASARYQDGKVTTTIE